MRILPRPWSQIEANIEAEIASKMQALRMADKPHDFRFIQGEIDGLERALQIARREPAEAIPDDSGIYP